MYSWKSALYELPYLCDRQMFYKASTLTISSKFYCNQTLRGKYLNVNLLIYLELHDCTIYDLPDIEDAAVVVMRNCYVNAGCFSQFKKCTAVTFDNCLISGRFDTNVSVYSVHFKNMSYSAGKWLNCVKLYITNMQIVELGELNTTGCSVVVVDRVELVTNHHYICPVVECDLYIINSLIHSDLGHYDAKLLNLNIVCSKRKKCHLDSIPRCKSIYLSNVCCNCELIGYESITLMNCIENSICVTKSLHTASNALMHCLTMPQNIKLSSNRIRCFNATSVRPCCDLDAVIYSVMDYENILRHSKQSERIKLTIMPNVCIAVFLSDVAGEECVSLEIALFEGILHIPSNSTLIVDRDIAALKVFNVRVYISKICNVVDCVLATDKIANKDYIRSMC